VTDDPMEFFRPLYGRLEPESAVIEFRVLKNEGGSDGRLFTMNPIEIQDLARKYNAGNKVSVYFGVAPRKIGSTTGKKTDVAVIPALWCDVDVLKMGWDMDRTLGLIKGHELRPSAIVNSGNGLHLYWRLEDAFIPPTDENAQYWNVSRVEETMGLLATVFAGDNTHDISRLLRVPGTWNTKGDKAKRVKVEMADWRDYALDDLYTMAQETNRLIDASDYISRDEMKRRAKEAAANEAMGDMAGSFVREAGYQARRLSWQDIWNLAKYGGAPRGTAFIGLDEAILRATALLYASAGNMNCKTESERDEKIISLTLAKLREVHEKQRPTEPWDRTREKFERVKINDKLQRFKPRWDALMEEREAQKRRKKNVRKAT
jgi:hypothetical protein